MGDLEGAMNAYEQALRHNQWSIPAMNAISCILRTKEQFPKAIEYLQNILKLDPSSGETWGSLGHCHLMMDNLQEAYTSYQQALYHLRDPKASNHRSPSLRDQSLISFRSSGTQALVRHWYFVRSLRLVGPRRRSFLAGHAHGPRIRESQRNLLPPRNNIQAAAEVQPELGGMSLILDLYRAVVNLSQCFKYIVSDPPRPLTEEDIWFQIGHVHEQQKDVS